MVTDICPRKASKFVFTIQHAAQGFFRSRSLVLAIRSKLSAHNCHHSLVGLNAYFTFFCSNSCICLHSVHIRHSHVRALYEHNTARDDRYRKQY